MPEWPDWWRWELTFTPHLFKRMADRGFNESDLRTMLEDATGFRSSAEPGRWIIHSRLQGHPWEVIVEPLPEEQLLLVVTAYRLE